MEYFDTHAHFNDAAFNGTRNNILNECSKNNIRYIVNVGASLKDSIESVELAEKYPYIYAAIGIHPEYIKEKVQNIYDLYQKSDTSRIVAIGEIGLDYHYTKEYKDEQKKIFIEQIELSNELKLPVLIHTRDASLDTYNILKSEKIPVYGVLLHCFNPTDDLVRLVLERGYTVAFGGNITYKRNQSFKKYLMQIPIEQIVLETDSPYLPPVPFRGTINSSLNLPIICKKLAEYKEMDEIKVSEIVFNNSVSFYNIKNKELK